jgi:AdoMet-dependent heme synthase
MHYGISDGGPAAGDSGHPAADVAAREPRRRREALDSSAPRVVAWEVTRSCNLACAHCRASARHGPYEGELSTDECLTLVAQIAAAGKPILILTGGEPLLRADIFTIAEAARDAGLRAVMAPNGTLITAANAARMKAAGIARISVSIDFPDAVAHDRFRGCPGAFDSALQGIRVAQDAGIEIQVNSTITRLNVAQLPRLLALAEELGAVSFHPFLLVPTGRGRELAEQELDPDDYERTLNWLYDAQQTSGLFFKPTDVPHYWRVMRQRARAEGRKLEVHPHSHGGMDTLSRGCLAGVGFCFISHVGDVQPCGYFDRLAGNVRAQPFADIWRGSPLFAELRDLEALKGKCGACEYKRVCGGCRARAYERTGDYLAEEPYCAYQPRGWSAVAPGTPAASAAPGS